MARTLTREQARELGKAFFPHLNFFFRLKRGMERVGFLPEDPLYQLLAKAYDAAQALSVELHYRSCGHGVGRSETDGE
jgi:hypothetical protein